MTPDPGPFSGPESETIQTSTNSHDRMGESGTNNESVSRVREQSETLWSRGRTGTETKAPLSINSSVAQQRVSYCMTRQ